MKYYEFKKHWENKYNALPVEYAFNKEQFKEVLLKFELNENNMKENLISLGGGAYMKSSDYHLVNNFLDESIKALNEYLSNDENLFNAIYYELENYEYYYSWDTEQIYDALNLSIDNERHNTIFKNARKEYIKFAKNNY